MVSRSKTWRVTVLGLASLVFLGAITWQFILPQYRPNLLPGETYGIDVSHHQGRIDWSRVAADDMSFAYIKATEGGDHVDTRFAENWEGAGRAGLTRGPYHFFTLCSSGEVQARNFLTVVPADPNGLPPAVDLELAGNCSARPDKATVHREIREFLHLVEDGLGQEALLYIGNDFESMYGVREVFDRPLWHLRFLLRPDVDGWVVWQVMGFAQIEGIAGNVDLDVLRNGG
jgi:lysozyme